MGEAAAAAVRIAGEDGGIEAARGVYEPLLKLPPAGGAAAVAAISLGCLLPSSPASPAGNKAVCGLRSSKGLGDVPTTIFTG